MYALIVDLISKPVVFLNDLLMEMPEVSVIILWEVFLEKNKLINKKMAELQ